MPVVAGLDQHRLVRSSAAGPVRRWGGSITLQSMELRPLDIADDSTMAQAYAVETAANIHLRPHWIPLGEEARLLVWRADHGWHRTMLGAYGGESLLGVAVSETSEDDTGTSWIDVSVLPEHQQRGVGSALVAAAERASPATAHRFVAQAALLTTDAASVFAERFARPLGYTIATRETVVRLDLGSVELPRADAPSGYTVDTFVDGVPEKLRGEVGRIKGLVDSEAPNGDLGWAESPISPAQYLQEIELAAAQGRKVIESVALAPDGAVAAWTCLLVSSDPRRPAATEGTLVLREHRGRRLGRAVKSACLAAAREHGVVTVKTSSDDDNVWMRSLNAALGFVPVEHKILVQKARRLRDTDGRSTADGPIPADQPLARPGIGRVLR